VDVRGDIPLASERRRFFRVVKAGFGQRRKQLVNALCGGLGLAREEVLAALAAAGIDARRRAETLSLDEWRGLGREFQREAPAPR
jgi:16S rRNA (adenine1518-N6/adenine1519-N6)-dimethyltransferase